MLFIWLRLGYIFLVILSGALKCTIRLKETLDLTRKSLCPLLWLVFLIFGTASGAAGEMPVLGLNEMIQMALEKSPEMKEAEQDVVAAQSYLAQAKAGQWAQLEVVAVGGPAQNADLPTIAVTQATGRWTVSGTAPKQ